MATPHRKPRFGGPGTLPCRERPGADPRRQDGLHSQCRFAVPRSGAERAQCRYLDPDQPLRHAAAACPRRTQRRAGSAESYSVSDDGLTFALKLRPNTKFADGSPITVGDVKWSLDRARNPKNGTWNFTLESIASISTQGTDTVVLHLKHPDPALTASLAIFNSSIMPQKLFEATPGATDADKAKAFAEKPIGSGPFVLASWQRGTQMVLKRNPYYWQAGEDGKPLPYLDELDFQIVPDDATRILKLQAGEVDGAEFIPYSRVAELKGDRNLNMTLFLRPR
jgi:peptide/nickel transport system substrate-binding protein